MMELNGADVVPRCMTRRCIWDSPSSSDVISLPQTTVLAFPSSFSSHPLFLSFFGAVRCWDWGDLLRRCDSSLRIVSVHVEAVGLRSQDAPFVVPGLHS